MIPKTKKKLLPAIISLLAATGVAVAQTNLPFDRLRPNFRGTDPVSVYQVVAKHQRSFRKGKFESTKAFQDRIDRLLRTIRIAPGLTAVDAVTFVSYDLSESYDADSEKFEFRISGDSVSESKHDDSEKAYFRTTENKGNVGSLASVFEPSPLDELQKLELTESEFDSPLTRFNLRLRDATKLHGSSVGQNAFGVKRRYKIKSYTSLNLILVGDDLSRLNTQFKLDASPNRARIIAGNVGIAITGKLRFPIIGYDHTFDEATITEPEESHYFHYSLRLVPDTVTIFNVKTGEIYGTVRFPEQGDSTKPKLGNRVYTTSGNRETWQMISNRTGVSVSDLMTANPGMTEPQGKVFVPATRNNVPMNVRIVKAQAGDTVEKLAMRYGVDGIEVAKLNGLLPSSVLGAGREIKISMSIP